jgi:hypothetical protein
MVAIRYLTKPDGTKFAWIIGGNPLQIRQILDLMSEDELAIFESFFGF